MFEVMSISRVTTADLVGSSLRLIGAPAGKLKG